MDQRTLENFISLFATDAPVFYRVRPKPTAPGKKVETDNWPITGQPEPEDFADHINGERALSIVLNKSGATDGLWDMVTRAAVDIDDYGTDPAGVAETLQNNGIGHTLTLSKSGGIHVHLFFKAPIPAKKAQDLAERVGALLGIEAGDYFPKQHDVSYHHEDNPDGNKGNGLNLCYFGDNRTGWRDGQTLTLEQFVADCGTAAMDEDEVDALREKLPAPKRKTRAVTAQESVADDKLNRKGMPFYDGPPCLQKIAQGADAGDPLDHDRNSYLYNVAVYLKMAGFAADQDSLENALAASNFKHLATPLDMKDVKHVAKSVWKTKNANYACGKEPICSLCNRGACNKRVFGAAMQGQSLWFDMEIITPPLLSADGSQRVRDPDFKKQMVYRITVDGVTFEFHSEAPKFPQMKEALADAGLPHMDNHDAAQWARELAVGMKSAVRIEVAEASASTVEMTLEAMMAYVNENADDRTVHGWSEAARYADSRKPCVVIPRGRTYLRGTIAIIQTQFLEWAEKRRITRAHLDAVIRRYPDAVKRNTSNTLRYSIEGVERRVYAPPIIFKRDWLERMTAAEGVHDDEAEAGIIDLGDRK